MSKPDFDSGAGLKLLGVAAIGGLLLLRNCDFKQAAKNVDKIPSYKPKPYEVPTYPKHEPYETPKTEKELEYPTELNDIIEDKLQDMTKPDTSKKNKY